MRYRIVGSRCHVLQLKFLQSIRNEVSISIFSVFAPEAIFLLVTVCRKSSELFIFDVEDAPDKVVKFLLLPDATKCDVTDKLSLVIEEVDAPKFAEVTSKLFDI